MSPHPQSPLPAAADLPSSHLAESRLPLSISGTVPFIWVSPYAPDDGRGGWKAMQFHLLQALEAKLGAALRIAPVDVPEKFLGKWFSRVQKKFHIPRCYAYYSESRLASFARAVESKLPTCGSQPIIFFGALPFVKCRPAAPYFIYTDGAFFIHYWEYNQDHSHAKQDIKRICAAEAEFMRRSAGVWCSSQWVADRITREYQLPAGLARCVGTGPGNVPLPVEPVRYENYLVMVAGDFERKGGRLAVGSVTAARKLGVDASLKFIGAKPPPDVLALPFVEWCGWLDCRQEADRRRFAEVLSRAGAQILLSRSDLTPLVIPEAAGYGKATLAAAVGGIPEMIRDGETGWLVRPEDSAAAIGGRIALVFKEPDRLTQAGAAAKSFCAEHWSWNSTASRCCMNIK
jgi:glycosyltransferase involved in cell wall biosynthesis